MSCRNYKYKLFKIKKYLGSYVVFQLGSKMHKVQILSGLLWRTKQR